MGWEVGDIVKGGYAMCARHRWRGGAWVRLGACLPQCVLRFSTMPPPPAVQRPRSRAYSRSLHLPSSQRSRPCPSSAPGRPAEKEWWVGGWVADWNKLQGWSLLPCRQLALAPARHAAGLCPRIRLHTSLSIQISNNNRQGQPYPIPTMYTQAPCMRPKATTTHQSAPPLSPPPPPRASPCQRRPAPPP